MKHGTQAPTEWRSEIVPVVTVLVFSAAYFLLFFNRFAGLRSGDGEFGGGIAFLAGLRPYRDYFTAGPPLNALKSALELAAFGKLLIVSRILAVVERCLIAATLYVWLRKLFSRNAAWLGAVLTVVVSAGDHTDPLASYNHDAIFFAMLCGLVATYATEASSERKAVTLAAFAGIFGALSLLTKQTVGAFALLSVGLCGCLAEVRMRTLGRAARWGLAFVVGTLLPISAVAIYLWHLGALRACVQMMFVSGPRAKASHPLVFVSREIMIAGFYHWWLLLAVMAIGVSGRALYLGVLRENDIAGRSKVFLLSAGGALVLLMAKTVADHGTRMLLKDTGKGAVYFVLLGTAFASVIGLQQVLNSVGSSQVRALQITLFSLLALAVAVSLSLSFPAFEAMALPGLGLLVAAIYAGAGVNGRRFVLLVTAVLVFFQVCEKLAIPFGFDHQDEGAVKEARSPSSEPMLKGMRLTPNMVGLIDAVQSTIQSRAGNNGRLFTYPEMGLLYSITGRYPPTRTASHNIDVVEDGLAISEAARLLAAPPAVVVYAKPSETDMHVAELVWREGHPSGQRKITEALDQITARYDLIGTYQLMPQDTPIRIYAKPLR